MKANPRAKIAVFAKHGLVTWGDAGEESYTRTIAVIQGAGTGVQDPQAARNGGSIVFVASKDALASGKNAAASSTAKAAELHLARCLAEEGGSSSIRVNSVNPDAVLQDLGISLAGGTSASVRHQA